MAQDVDTGGAGGGAGLDLFTLMRVDTSQITALGFQDAKGLVADAMERFANVQSVVTNGVAWTGEGQPRAAVVMRSNTAALETARVQMAAATGALEALATAIGKAQSKANAIVSTQVGFDVDLRDYLDGAGASVVIQTDVGPAEIYRDGRVFLTTHEEPVPVPGNQAKLESVLTYARSADLAASQLLNRINAARPVFSAVATGKTLAYNQTLHTIAEVNRILAKITKHTWNELGPFDWEPLPERRSWSWTSAVSAFTGLPNPFDVKGLTPRDLGLALLSAVSKKGPIVGLPFSAYDALEAGTQRPDAYPGPKGVRTPFDDSDLDDDKTQILELALRLHHGIDADTYLGPHETRELDRLGALEGGPRGFDAETRAFARGLETWQNGTLGEETRDLNGWEETFRHRQEQLELTGKDGRR